MTVLDRGEVLEAIDAEPELLDEMPDEMLAAVQESVAAGGKEAFSELLRVVTRLTKRGIRARVLSLTAQVSGMDTR